MPNVAVETCSRCGNPIPAQQQVFLYHDRPMCGRCYQAKTEKANHPPQVATPTSGGTSVARATERHPEPVQYAPPDLSYLAPPTANMTPKAPVPDYTGLRVASSLLGATGVVLIVGGLVLLGYAVYLRSLNRLSVGDPLVPAATGLGLLVSGFLYNALSSACDALRDIARNSWR